MRLSQRSYPHPVVGNRDDVPQVAFQAAVEMSTDKETVYVAVSINSSCQEINRFIESGRASYVAHIECSNTLFRRAYQFSEPSFKISIPSHNLNDAVEVNVFVCAAKKISGYRLKGAHRDYGESAFDVSSGDVLAIAEGHVFYIESEFDSLKRIGSIMQIAELPQDGDLPMKVDYNGDKISVYLSKQDFKEYKQLRSQELSAPLTTSIVLPALMEALHQIEEEEAGDDDPRRWVRVIHRRISEMGLQAEEDCLIKAQRLLELPLKRALAATRQVAEATS